MVSFTYTSEFGDDPEEILNNMLKWGECLNEKIYWKKFIRKKLKIYKGGQQGWSGISYYIHANHLRNFDMFFDLNITNEDDLMLIKLVWG